MTGVAARGRLPEGPRSSALEQTARFAYGPEAFFDECAARYGRCFTLQLTEMPPLVVVGEPELAREVLENNETFSGAAGNRQTMIHRGLGEDALVGIDGERHEIVTRLVGGAIDDAFNQHLPSLRAALVRHTQDLDHGAPVLLLEHLQRVVADFAVTLVFGSETPRRAELMDSVAAVLATFQIDGQPLLVPNFSAFLLARERVYRVLDQEIEARQDRGALGATDLLSRLIEPDQALLRGHLSRDQLRAQLFSVTLAGFDTTANTLAWTLHHVLRHPAVRRFIELDVRAVAGGATSRAELGQLRAIRYAVNEAMRLHPVTPFVNRMTRHMARLDRWIIPAGVMVCPSPYLLGRHPDYGEAVSEFRLGRDFKAAVKSGRFLPFGNGAHGCIGEHLARPEMALVIGTLLAGYDIRLMSTPPRPQRRGFVLIPDNGVPAVVRTARARG